MSQMRGPEELGKLDLGGFGVDLGFGVADLEAEMGVIVMGDES